MSRFVKIAGTWYNTLHLVKVVPDGRRVTLQWNALWYLHSWVANEIPRNEQTVYSFASERAAKEFTHALMHGNSGDDLDAKYLNQK
jgi:hypothetical protein